MSAQLHVVGPRNKNRSVPVRRPNDDLRSREYLTVAEVERLIKAAQHGRYGHRDATLILVAFRPRAAGLPIYVIWNGPPRSRLAEQSAALHPTAPMPIGLLD